MATCIVRANPLAYMAEQFYKGDTVAVSNFFERKLAAEKKYLTNPKQIVKAINDEVKRLNLTKSGKPGGEPIKLLIKHNRFPGNKQLYELMRGVTINREYDGTQPLDQKNTESDKFYNVTNMKKIVREVVGSLKEKGVISPSMQFTLDGKTYKDQYGNPRIVVNMKKMGTTDSALKEKFDGKRSITVGKMLDNLISSESTYEELARHLKDTLGKANKLKISLATEKKIFQYNDKYDKAPNGVYVPEENAIYINEDVKNIEDEGKADKTIMHEIMHLAVLNAKRDEKQTAELKNIFERVKSGILAKYGATDLEDLKGAYEEAWIGQREATGHEFYGLTNEDEFVAELFTNPIFLQEVASLDERDSARQMSLWDRFVNWLADLLGLKGIKLNGLAFDAAKLVDEILREGGGEINENLQGRSTIQKPSDWDYATWMEMQQNFIPYVQGMSDNEIQSRINDMEITPLMEMNQNDKVKDWNDFIASMASGTPIQATEEQSATDYFESLSEMGIEESESTTLRKYLTDGIHETFKTSATPYKRNSDLVKNTREKYPEIVYENEVQRRFEQECRLTNQELNELCDDIATTLMFEFDNLINGTRGANALKMLHPTIFTNSMMAEIAELSTRPADRQYFDLATLLGAGNIIHMIRHDILNNPMCPPTLMDKLQIFAPGNTFSSDFMRYLILKANPSIKERLGFTFNTEIKQNSDNENLEKRYPIEGDQNSEDGESEIVEVVNETSDEDSDRIEEEQDSNNNDFIKEDSLTKSFLENIDKPLKSALQRIPKNGQVSSFGRTKVFSWSEVANPLVRIISKTNGSASMMDAIRESSLSFKDSLLRILEKDPQIASRLFSNFKKIETEYFSVDVTEDENKNRNVKLERVLHGEAYFKPMAGIVDLAESGDERSLFDASVNISGEHAKQELFVNINGLKAYRNALASVKTHAEDRFYNTDKATVSSVLDDNTIDNILRCIESLGFVGRLDRNSLRGWMIDIKTVQYKDGTSARQLDLDRYNKLVDLLQKAYNNVAGTHYTKEDLSKVERDLKISNRAEFIKAVQGVAMIVDSIAGTPVERMVNNHGKDFSSFTNSNYIGRVFNALQYDPANGGRRTARQFIEEEFKNSPFFKWLFDRDAARGVRKCSWLTDLYYSVPDTRLMHISTLSTYNGKKFHELSPLEQMTMKLTLFTWDKTGMLADYISPVMSDKTRAFAITNKKHKASEIMENLYQVMMQEIDRMSMLVQRAKGNIPSSYQIPGYDVKLDESGKVELKKNGMRFVFIPFFNDTLVKINDDSACRSDALAAWMHDMVYKDGKYAGTYNNATVQNLANDVIKQQMKYEYDSLRNSLVDSGSLTELMKNLHTDSKGLDAILQSYSINSFFANTQIYQILTGDLALYNDKSDIRDDIVKRFAEVVSDGMEQDPDAVLSHDTTDGSERVYWHPDDELYQDQPVSKTYVILNDIVKPFRNIDEFMKLHAQRRDNDIAKVERKFAGAANKEKREDLIRRINYLYSVKENIYRKINTTDGQGFMSFRGYDSMMHALGRGADLDTIYNEYSRLYDRFADLFKDDVSYEQHSESNRAEDKKWIKDFWELHADVQKFNRKNGDKLHFEVVKQMTYTQIGRDGVKVPMYIKNSEFPLLDIERMMDEAVTISKDGIVYRQGDSTLAKTASFMHRNYIDTVLFESNVKVGAIQVMDYKAKTLSQDLSKASLGSDSRSQWVCRVPVRDVLLQQETVDHALEHEQPTGAQYKNFAFGSVNPSSMVDDGLVYETGKVVAKKQTKADSLRAELESLMSDRMRRYSDKLIDKYGLQDDLLTQRVKLRSAILSHLASSGENNYDTQYRFSINDNGEFNVPLSEPNSRRIIDGMFTSAIKKAALEVDMPGGQLVQVTDGFRFDSDKVSAQADKSLRIAYKRADGSITYNVGEAVAIAYFEAEMPYYYKSMYKLGDELDERLSRLVMYRIPTEGACSMFPIKVVKWSNRINGGIVKLPAEIPGIGGMDYDIDKLFFMAPSVNVVKEKYVDPATGKTKDGKVIAIDYVTKDYAGKVPGNDDKADCNRILEIYWAMLTTPENMQAMFIPSNFKDLEHNKNVIQAMEQYTYSDDNDKLKHYDELQSSDDKVIVNNMAKDKELSVCGAAFQLDKSIINSIAKRLLGIFANANSQHVYMQGRDISLMLENVSGKCSLNGNSLENRIPFDSIIANDGFTKIYENITQFLTASADAVKNPTLHEIGVNEFTVNAVVAMLRSGFDIETICLVMQQPIVKMLVNDYEYECAQKTDNRKVNVMNVLNNRVAKLANIKYGQGFKKKIQDSVKVSNVTITKQDLLKHLGKSLFGENWKDAQMKNDQFTILKLIYGFFSAKQIILDSNKILKIDISSSRHGSDTAEYVDHINSISDFEDFSGSKIAGFPDLEHGKSDPMLKRLFTSYALQKYMFGETTKTYDPRYIEFMKTVRDSSLFDYGTSPYPNSRIFNLRSRNVYEDWMWFNFVNDPTGTNNFSFGTDAATGYMPWTESLNNYFKTKFANDAAKAKMQLLKEMPDNEFLKHLVIDYNEIKLPAKSVAKGDDVKVGDGLSDLFNNRDRSVSGFAKALIMYDWYKNGFRRTSNTFWNYLPARDLSRLDNVMSFWRKVEMGNTHDDIDDFILSFLYNNPAYANGEVIQKIRELKPYLDSERDFRLEHAEDLGDLLGWIDNDTDNEDSYNDVEIVKPVNVAPLETEQIDTMTDSEILKFVNDNNPIWLACAKDMNPEITTDPEAARRVLKKGYEFCPF